MRVYQFNFSAIPRRVGEGNIFSELDVHLVPNSLTQNGTSLGLQFYIQIPEFMNVSAEAVPGEEVVTLLQSSQNDLNKAGFTLVTLRALFRVVTTTMASTPEVVRQRDDIWKYVLAGACVALLLTLIGVVIILAYRSVFSPFSVAHFEWQQEVE